MRSVLGSSEEADVSDWGDICRAAATANVTAAEGVLCRDITRQQPLYSCTYTAFSSFWQVCATAGVSLYPYCCWLACCNIDCLGRDQHPVNTVCSPCADPAAHPKSWLCHYPVCRLVSPPSFCHLALMPAPTVSSCFLPGFGSLTHTARHPFALLPASHPTTTRPCHHPTATP